MAQPARAAGGTSPSGPAPGERERWRAKVRLAIVLAWAAGVVDAVGYITLFHVFTAQMSGNTVTLGVHLGQHDLTRALARGFPIAAFLFGVALGVAFLQIAKRRQWRSRIGAALLIEVGLLSLFMGLAHALISAGTLTGSGPGFLGLIALLVVALGFQNAALQQIGGQTVRTTYVTGMLTNIANETVTYLFRRWDARRRTGKTRSERDPRATRILALAAIYVAFALGAFEGGLTQGRWSVNAMIPAAVGLTAMALLDLRRPAYAPGR